MKVMRYHIFSAKGVTHTISRKSVWLELSTYQAICHNINGLLGKYALQSPNTQFVQHQQTLYNTHDDVVGPP